MRPTGRTAARASRPRTPRLADLRARADEGDYLFSLNRYVFLATAA